MFDNTPTTDPAPGSTSTTEAAKPAADEPLQPQWERDTLRTLALASLNEQRAARRVKNTLSFLWLAVAIFCLWQFFGPESQKTVSPSEHTAMIEIRGEIAGGAEASAEALIPALRAAFEDSNAKGVALLINSPGGSPVHAGMINDEIRRLKSLHNKPVVAVVQESAASAAYYIAVAADDIYVDKASIVGSIGVLMDGFGFTGLMDKLGVERRLLTSGSNKGMLDPFSPLDPKQRALTQAMLTQVHQQFIDTVKAGRGKRLKETPETFSGLFWNGQQAIALGLADGLGSMDSVARDVIKAEEVVDYTRRDNVAEKLAKRFGAAIGEGLFKASRASGPALR